MVRKAHLGTPQLLLATAMLLMACNSGPAPPGRYFEEITHKTGIDYSQFKGYKCFDPVICGPDFMTGGVAVADFDSDGNPDLLVTRIDATPILYRNNGDGTFADVSDETGIAEEPKVMRSNGAAWADLENKGCPDLILTSVHDHRNYLFVNDCKGRFRELGVERGLAYPRETESVYGFGIALGDYDRDGYLDVMLGEWRYDAIFPGAPSNTRLLRNLGANRPGYFEDTTEIAGITVATTGDWLPGHFVFSPVFADLDRDGFQDIYLGADFNQGQLFWNNGNGSFVEGTRSARVDSDENGMGVAIADFDRDGMPDIFVSSIYQEDSACGERVLEREFCALWGTTGNRLYRNRGNRVFDDATDESGVRDGAWGWGSMPIDLENKGAFDIAQTAGQFWPFQGMGADRFHDDPTRLWRNNGSGQFRDIAAEAGVAATKRGKGLAILDIDSDGFQDLIVAENSGRLRIFRNLATRAENGWLQIIPRGTRSNRDGIGVVVTVTASPSAIPQYQELIGGSIYLGQSERILHFGLGPGSEPVSEIVLYWPITGCSQVMRDVPRNSRIVVEEFNCN